MPVARAVKKGMGKLITKASKWQLTIDH
jgi:hypothetical protein